jgi:hypothetical protein
MTDHWDDDFDFDDDLPEVEQPEFDQPELPDTSMEADLPDDSPWEEPDFPEIAEVADPEPVVVGDSVFPPSLDVGELPEPVDGFPWIDTGTLGAADPSGFTTPVEAVRADELAAYAGVDLPEGADPWTVLAADEDPATSALARWWTPGEQ